MENEKTIEALTQDASYKLVDSIHLLNVLNEITGYDPNSGTIISILQKYITSSFNDIELCRKKIHIQD